MKFQTRRVLMSVGGVLGGGVSVGFFKLATFGVDPFQALMSGLDSLVPLPFGTLYVIVNAVLLLFALIFDRRKINIATFVNLFLLGYVVQYAYALLQSLFPAPSLLLRTGCFLFGVITLCMASSLYITADLGVSTYDAVALILADRSSTIPFKYIRIITDLCCVLLGVALYLSSGGTLSGVPAFAGIGTVVTAFFMGPLISFFIEKLTRPLLYRGDSSESE